VLVHCFPHLRRTQNCKYRASVQEFAAAREINGLEPIPEVVESMESVVIL
jgi:hypothetical protein